jgi:hypothetical protein
MNIQKMMQQAQAMQARMEQELAAMKVEASSGGGMVKIEMSGKKEVLSVVIDKAAVGPERRRDAAGSSSSPRCATRIAASTRRCRRRPPRCSAG